MDNRTLNGRVYSWRPIVWHSFDVLIDGSVQMQLHATNARLNYKIDGNVYLVAIANVDGFPESKGLNQLQ